MSVQFKASTEALVESFQGATAELTLESKLKSEELSAPDEVIRSIAKVMATRPINYELHVQPHLTVFSPLPETQPARLNVEATIISAEQHFRNWWNTFLEKLRGTDDRLRTLATEIIDKAKELGVTVEEYLRRMQRHLYGWILANSAVESFSVGSGKDRITFAPDKLTSSGKFEFGPIGDSITSVADLIGVLKVIPSISVEVDVEYTVPTKSIKPKSSPRRKH